MKNIVRTGLAALAVVFAFLFSGLTAQAKTYSPEGRYGDVNMPNGTDLREGYTANVVTKTAPMLLYSNRKLVNVTAITGDFFFLHTNYMLPYLEKGSLTVDDESTGDGLYHYHYENDDSGEYALCQFQGKFRGAYLLVCTLKLTQVGSDIYAQVVGTSYPYSSAKGSNQETTTFAVTYFEDLSAITGSTGGMCRECLSNVELEFVAGDITSTVTFVDGVTGETISTVADVPYATAVEAPTAPTHDGYVFCKWDTDFSVVKKDMTVTALYHKLCTVTFKDYDGTVLKTQENVEETTGATAPDDPTREGYTFNGWDVDFSAVTDDLTVTATYLKNYSVKFYKGVEGGYTLISEQSIASGKAATAPDSADAAIDGYVFKSWATAFDSITEDTEIYGVYNKLWTVTFVDDDGSALEGAVNATQSIENGTAAAEPNLDAYTGSPIVGWDPEDFSNITADTVVKAIHGEVPEIVTKVVNTGKLETEDSTSTILIWNGGATGTWDAETKNWYDTKGMAKVWVAGATAVFADSATVTVSGTQSVGKIITLADAGAVTFAGDEIDFVAPAVARFAVNSTLRFENKVGGTAGYIQMADAEITAETDIAGDYAATTGWLAISNGTFKVVEAGKLGGGTMKASVFLANDTVYEFDSTATQTYQAPINMTGRGTGTTTTGRFVIGANAYLTINCSGEYDHRIFAETHINGYAYFPDGNYHDFYNNTKGIYIHDGGTMSLGSGYGSYGHRNWKILVEKGGKLIYRSSQNIGSADTNITVDGGEVNFPKDYRTSGQDDYFPTVVLKNGALISGIIHTWAFDQSSMTISGTNATTIATDWIRVGRSGDVNNWSKRTVSSSIKCLQTLDVADVTGDAAADLIVTSSLYANTSTVYTASTAQYFGIIKKGAGTVKFTGVSSNYCGSVQFNEGTIAFDKGASLSGDAYLMVTGDAELNLAKGATVTFSDSSAQLWTSGKVLKISGELSNKSVRVGTSADALTADQLAQIKRVTSNGTLRSVTIDDNGYLQLGEGFTLYFR